MYQCIDEKQMRPVHHTGADFLTALMLAAFRKLIQIFYNKTLFETQTVNKNTLQCKCITSYSKHITMG